MSWFIRFIGSILLFCWIAILFLGDDIKGFFPDEYKKYGDDLLNNKGSLLALAIVLSFVGTITKVKEVIKKRKQNHRADDLNGRNDLFRDNSPHNISSHENSSFRHSDHSSSYNHSSRNTSIDYSSAIDKKSTHVKQDFVKEQQQYKGRELANKQTGQLKEIALKVDWTPLRKGGANFKTSLLKQVNSSRLEVHKSKGGFLFSGLFASIGLGVMILGSYFIIADHGLSFTILGPIIFGGTFAAAGFAMLIYPRPRVFDRRYGWFWCGDKSLAREQDFLHVKESARLTEIAAIQIIDEHLSKSKGGSYTSWEINLVSKEGQRLNVMDHGNKNAILADAQVLSDFFGVPVWENT